MLPKITETAELKELQKDYWHAYHYWQVAKADPNATWRDLADTALECKMAFENLTAGIMKQHRKQHGRAPAKAIIVQMLNEWVSDEINRIYRVQKRG